MEWAPSSPILLGSFAMYASLYGEWAIGKELLDKVYENNLDFPLYLLGVTCLYYYKDGHYKEALDQAIKYLIPGFFMGPLLRCACYSQLGQMELANKNKEELIKLRPDFQARGRFLIGNYIKEDSLVGHVIEGLRKAGLNVD